MKATLIITAGLATLAVGALLLDSEPRAAAHCQIPCGIYDDKARFSHMLEDVTTITKAMTAIREMAGRHDAQSVNQVGRWIVAKEDHAAHIITTVSEYFLTQKVKEVPAGGEGYQKYLENLAAHHRVMRAAMKAKQSVDGAVAEDLKNAILTLQKWYS